jgi:hypothetical protein
MAVGLCALAPLVLVGASTVWGPIGTAATSSAGVPPAAAYVGAQQVDLNLKQVLTLDLGFWARLFEGGALSGVIPALLAALSGLLVGRCLLTGSRGGERTRRSITALLLLYWVPVLAFSAVAVYSDPRYLLFLQPLGYVLVAAALTVLAGTWGEATGSQKGPVWQRVAVVGLALALFANLGTGLLALEIRIPTRRPDPTPAYRFVAAHHAPGEPILVSWPPAAYFVLDDNPDLRYLAGEE